MKMRTRSLARCLWIIVSHAILSTAWADEKTIPAKPEKPAVEKGETAADAREKSDKKAAEESITKLSEALVKKDEKAALALMSEFKEVPVGYQAERLGHLMKWAASRGPVKVMDSQELKEVAVVIVDDAAPGRKKPDYDPMFFWKDGGVWKYADDDLCDTKRPLPFISDASRKEFAELLAWYGTRAAELRKSTK